MSQKSALSSVALLALLTMGGTALAGQTLSGTYIEANYGDNGMWNWGSTGTGLIYTTTGSGASQDATYPGTPWAHFQVEFEQGGSSYNQIANSSSGTTLTVVSEANESDSSALISVYEYTAGGLEITKIEYWEVDGTVISQQFVLHNAGSSDITNLRFQVATDPDHDLSRFGTYSTLNDVDDLDGDGVSDWTVSLGPSSGIAFGFAPCDPDSATLGHSPGWDQDADLSLTDYNFGSGDYSMNWVHYEGTLTAGDTAYASNLVVFADDATTAEGLVSSEADMCNICDSDGDGAQASWCGGDDCDDTDPSVYPSASEVCDGVDNDCDGTVDEDDAIDAKTWYQDADSDGYGNASVTDIDCYQPTGYVADDSDCDDSLAEVHPGAEEICGDGVKNDCDADLADIWEQCADLWLTEDVPAVYGKEDSFLGLRSLRRLEDFDGDGVPDLIATGSTSAWVIAGGRAFSTPEVERVATLDITGTSQTGSKGINLTGYDNSKDVVTTGSGTIQGVQTGIDLTNSDIANGVRFQYGDGSAPVASSIDTSGIAGNVAIVTTGVTATGEYDFEDIGFGTSNVSNLTGPVVFVVDQNNSSGAGTFSDPGSISEAAAATTSRSDAAAFDAATVCTATTVNGVVTSTISNNEIHEARERQTPYPLNDNVGNVLGVLT